MRLRTFTAPDMPTAMNLVREALGKDAVILSSRPDKGRGISITAAADGADEAIARHAAPIRNNPAAQRLHFEMHEVLRFHNVPELFIAKMMQKISMEHSLQLALGKLAEAYFAFDPLVLDSRPAPAAKKKSEKITMLIGPPGIGKTLTIARMAALAMDEQELTVITTDNKRAGGIEQLQAFTDILGLKLKIAATRTTLAQYLTPGKTRQHILIDTAGCNPYDAMELRELQSYASLPGIEPVLVLPAGGDSLEAIDMVESFMVLPVKRLLITRSDTARRFGGVLAAAAAHGLAFCNVSSSSSITEPLHAADGALMAQLLLRYQLQSSST